MEGKLSRKELDLIYDSIVNTNYHFDDYFKLSYINHDQFKVIQEKLSLLRRNQYFEDSYNYHWTVNFFRHFYKNSIKRRELIRKQPRVIAQRFIGKKNIREFIFKRDGNKCLSCGSKKFLQLDHIIPISRGGQNQLMNLQTLCRSCNSLKRDNYFDYRNKKVQ